MKYIEAEMIVNFVASAFIVLSFGFAWGNPPLMILTVAMAAMNIRTWIELTNRAQIEQRVYDVPPEDKMPWMCRRQAD